MNFTDVFIKRPVFASVLSLIVLLIGIVSYFHVPLRQFPEISATVITVSTSYPGANAKLMEGFVTTPLETAISAVNGIDFITASSSQGQSQITVQFKLNYDINAALADINSAVASARWQLPKSVNDPIIEKQDPNAMPVVWISFTSPKMTSEQITDYLQRVVQPRLQTIDGVSQAEIFGAREYAMRIWLNPQAMAAQGVTASDVQTALENNNLQTPTGEIKSELAQFSIQANTGLTSAAQFNHLVIPQSNNTNAITRIQDIGKAELGAKDYNFSALMNGKSTIFIGVIPKSTGNPLAVANEVQQMLAQLNTSFPQDLHAQSVWDNSKFIAESIHEVKQTILEATISVILIIFLFLGSLRTLIITAISIPLSLIGAFGIMALLGFTINTLTLLALVLAIGMVVDDAIVVSENIHRHIESGKSAKAAAILGAREIQFAVIAMTFTLAAVFAPIGFMSGLTGILFREFAFTLAGAVIISGFIALTLSPMMCSKLLQPRNQEGAFEKTIMEVTTWITHNYSRALIWVLNRRYIIVGGMALVFLGIYILYISLPKELAPKEDIGALLVFVNAPADANLRYTEAYTKEIAQVLDTIPEKTEYGIINGFQGVNSAIAFVALTPWSERKRGVNQIIASLFPQLMAIPGVMAFPLNPYSLPGSTGFMPVNFVLETTGSYEQLEQAMTQLLAAAHQNPMLVNVDTDLKLDKKQINVDIDRDRAAAMGISMDSIGALLNIAFGEPVVSQFALNGRGYDVIPQLQAKFRQQPDDIADLNVRTATGELVPLANIATLSSQVSPRSLNHFQQLRAATLTASLMPGYTMSQALDYLQTAAKKVMTTDMKYDFSGESRQFNNASSSMQQTFVFALILIFLVLAAQFESFRSPLVVMFTVPLSTFGALMLLKLTGSTMNIYTEIGIVTLVGLISKHGILMVEFANQLQEKGYSREQAIVEAAIIRFRPIIMTTMAMILGAVPLTLAVGAGAISRQQMGWTVLGGMLIGTIFTLFVIPTMYIWLATAKKTFTTGDKELDQAM